MQLGQTSELWLVESYHIFSNMDAIFFHTVCTEFNLILYFFDQWTKKDGLKLFKNNENIGPKVLGLVM